MSEFFWNFNENIRKKKSFKELSKHLIVSSENILDYYNHITFRIENLSDYLKIMNIINKRRSPKDMIPSVVFRGMSDYKWKLEPSYEREFPCCEGFENSMIGEMKTLRPEEFSKDFSNFDILAKMQHFGLPTRLLDFSTNPLVALYFACCDNPRNTGRVVCTTDTSSEYSVDLIEAICGLHKHSEYSGLYLEDIIGTEYISRYFLHTKIPLMQKPKYSNERIKRQSAIFMIFPSVIYDKGAQDAYDALISNSENDIKKNKPKPDNNHEITKYERIEKIYPMKKSSVPGINKEFPSCFVDGESFKKLKECYKSHPDFSEMHPDVFSVEFNKRLLHRFTITPTLQCISTDSMKKYFCSIIIEQKYKKQILNELDLMNINEAYLFPELEYTAKSVKEKYKSQAFDYDKIFN